MGKMTNEQIRERIYDMLDVNRESFAQMLGLPKVRIDSDTLDDEECMFAFVNPENGECVAQIEFQLEEWANG